MALTMLPDSALTGDGISADYNGDRFCINNAEAERCLFRGGRWFGVGHAGVFLSDLNIPRSYSSTDLRSRSALID